MVLAQKKDRKSSGFLNRSKPRRWRRGMVSLDESLLAAGSRPQVFQPHQPLVRGLAIPLCAPTMVEAPIGGKRFCDRLEPRDVLRAAVNEPSLIAVLLGFAQLRPEGCRNLVLTRHPSQDVLVRLYNEAGTGLIYPTWHLARSHREAMLENERTVNEAENTASDQDPKSRGMILCELVYKAVAPMLRLLRSKPVATRLASLVRTLTGRNLGHLPSADRDACWEAIITAVCEKRPVLATTNETNPQHQKRRRFAPNAPVVVLEAFELRGERYVCVYDPQLASDGTATAPRDVSFHEFLSELAGIYAVV